MIQLTIDELWSTVKEKALKVIEQLNSKDPIMVSRLKLLITKYETHADEAERVASCMDVVNSISDMLKTARYAERLYAGEELIRSLYSLQENLEMFKSICRRTNRENLLEEAKKQKKPLERPVYVKQENVQTEHNENIYNVDKNFRKARAERMEILEKSKEPKETEQKTRRSRKKEEE